MPLGGGACPKTAERPPVSELESPKLKTAGKLQGFRARTECGTSRSAKTAIIKEWHSMRERERERERESSKCE